MNGPVRKVAVACLILFAALMINANVIQVGEASELKRDPSNQRQVLAQLQRQRGSIVAGGQQIALSVPSNDRYHFLRQYPKDKLYADVTGYFALDNTFGMERTQTSFLDGDDSRLVVSRLSDLLTGRKQRGGSVATTIVPALQEAATQAFDGCGGPSGPCKGAVVALDPSTGAILAMVTAPTYDPNALAKHDIAAVDATATALNRDPGQPLLNRAVNQLYPPGSTFKLITAAAALTNGDTPDTQLDSPTVVRLPQSTKTLTNFNGEQCAGAETSLTDALKISCNTAFANLGKTLGAAKLQAQAEQFGLNNFGTNKTISDFPLQKAPSESLFPTGLDQASTMLSAIGQSNVKVTPLQMAEVTAAIANNGTLMKPYLIDRYIGPDLRVVSKTSPQVLSHPVSADVAAELNQMMQRVVNESGGTGFNARVDGWTVAGKTGTAQNENGQAPHSWFVGFAPAQNPKIAIAVLVENSAGDQQGTGGTVAAPIAQKVLMTAKDVLK